jgi:hypothetical protein
VCVDKIVLNFPCSGSAIASNPSPPSAVIPDTDSVSSTPVIPKTPTSNAGGDIDDGSNANNAGGDINNVGGNNAGSKNGSVIISTPPDVGGDLGGNVPSLSSGVSTSFKV